MTAFPQLSTGACAQYPLERTRTRRTVTNRLEDGSRVTYADSGSARAEWQLRFSALSDAEAAAITELFTEVEGRLRTFVFLDPAANLLRWSEDFAMAVWQHDPMIQVTSGIGDPFGTARATWLVNGGQVAQRVTQSLPAAPAAYFYCFSAWVRSAAGSTITLVRSVGAAQSSTDFAPGGTWTRVWSTGALPPSEAAPAFAIELAAGASVEIFGAQVEAQIAPSEYMLTRSVSGVYPAARFDMDKLAVTSQGPDENDLILRIVSAEGA